MKKSIGRLIVKLNSEILEFLPEQKKVTNEVQLSSKGVVIRDSIKVKKDALEEALSGLEARRDYIIQESLEKFVKMIKCNITTAQKLLETETDSVDVNEMEITNAKEEAYKTVDEVLKNEDLAEVEMRKLTSTLANLAQDDFDKDNSENKDEENVKRELTAIGSYQAERFQKMDKEIKEKMKFYKDELLSKWIQQKEILDYQALKEIRSEFEVTHKKLRFMVNEWERRKYSDILSDYLVDLIDIMFDDYMVEFRKMDEEKRTEAAVLRKKNIELEDYKREKKRAIPSWPKSLTYTKFKPDLLSWDKEHHLSTGSVKFGLLAEMLKTQGRITVYEQIQTRLGKSRNDSNIIPQVVTLLDAINEETVYNKLCSAWDDFANLKKTKDESLNNFFSRFETLQYSMNLADDAFVEQEPLEKGKEFTYYEEREKMLSRKVELNDKLKAVQLLKALGVDENHKRDILAKVNFNREPKQVYEDTKTAIRDICGETSRELEKDLEKPDEVNIVKPWQERKADFSGPRPHFSRSRSRDDWRRNRSQERRPRSYSRDFDRSRERSDSRGRSRRRSVAFQDKRRVPVEKVRPDYHGEVNAEESYVEPDDDEDRFAAEETPVVELAKDLDLAEENTNLKKKMKDLEVKIDKLELKETEPNKETDEQVTKVLETRLEKKRAKKEKIADEVEMFPKLGQQILFKERSSDIWKSGKVVQTFKKTSKYNAVRNIDVEDEGRIQYDFGRDIEVWKENLGDGENDDILESFFLHEELSSVFPVQILPKRDYHKPEIQEAMQSEISRAKDFKAFEEVDDVGQRSIPIKWVVSKQKEDGKNQPFKARRCIRGDLEKGKENIRADSPTASKESLKLALAVAANEGFKVRSADIKSAYLQGRKLERKIYVKPPTEAGVEGKLWLLLQGAYGILDGGRLFYLQMADTLEGLGCHRIHSDGAFFTFVKKGKLQGLVILNVDDLIIAGNERFEKEIVTKLQEVFKFSKVEEKSFTYCGCRVNVNVDDGSIELDQNAYVDSLETIDHMEGEDGRELLEHEKKKVRAKVGELLWLSLMTRPDLSYDINAISSEISKATVKTAKELNKIISRAKDAQNTIKFIKL